MWPFKKRLPALPPAPEPPVRRRGFEAAKSSRLTGDFNAFEGVSNDVLGYALPVLRARSRNLARNNGYMRKFLRLMKINVLGPDGIRLRSAATTKRGSPDPRARDLVESAWNDWGLYHADYKGNLSFRRLSQQILNRTIVDGEVLAIKVRGVPGNPYGLALQLKGAEYLAPLNQRLAGGVQIVNGVEVDAGGRTLAFHLYDSNPDANLFLGPSNRIRRVPATDVIHVWLREDDEPDCTRGVPWSAAAIMDAKMLAEVMKSETVRARVESSKMGFFTENSEWGSAGDGYTGQGDEDDGSIIDEVSPGLLVKLPPGVDFKQFDPSGKSDLPPFIKAIMRKIASGLGVSYNSLASDLEGVNFGSLRGGYLEDQENYQLIQKWLAEELHLLVYREWLQLALLSGRIGNLGVADLPRLMPHEWLGRRWPWIDPLKDAQAAKTWIEIGVASRAEMIRQRGRDINDVDQEIEADDFKQPAKSEPAAEPAAEPTDGEDDGSGEDSQAATG